MTGIRAIQVAVAEAFGIPLIEMTSHRRGGNVARVRQVAMYLARELTPRSLPDIGKWFGDRDHTTVMHAIARVESLIVDDLKFAATVKAVRARLEASDAEIAAAVGEVERALEKAITVALATTEAPING